MASTIPLVGFDERSKDRQLVKEDNEPPLKRSRASTPWTPAEEHRLKAMRDTGNSWGEIAKIFPNRTEGSVKKHWYKDMQNADFAEDDSVILLAAIKEYEKECEASKWKDIGQKVGRSADVKQLSHSALLFFPTDDFRHPEDVLEADVRQKGHSASLFFPTDDFRHPKVVLAATRESKASFWKVIGQRVGKPAKACEKYAMVNLACQDRWAEPSPYAKEWSSMSFRESDGTSIEEKGVGEGDETPSEASDYREHQSRAEPSIMAASIPPYLQHHHWSDLQVPTVSSKSRPVFPSTLGPIGLGWPTIIPIAAKNIAAKSEGEIEPTLRGNQNRSLDNSMNMIATKVRRIIARRGTIRATLVIGWDLLDFMKTQYPDDGNAKLGSVITLSGTVLRAQATTCSDYAQKTWPAQGLNVIMAFQSAISSRNHKAEVSVTDLRIDVDVGQVCTLDIQSNSPDIIVEVFQQAIWMGAALRVTSRQRVQYSTFNLEHEYAQSFIVKFHELALSEEEQSCWLPMFNNPLIARGFPVPKRENGEQGLEIPLEIMAALGGARHVTEFQGGLVLKGHSTMFVPIKRYHQSIQWHLIKRHNNQRILYQELNSRHPKRATVEGVDHEALWNTRAFLGWWKSAEIHLGTAETAYNNIDWSSAGEAKRPAKFSGANIGFQTMITGQLNFIMGAKDGRLHFSQNGPFQRILQCAENTPVVLYDIEDHRAWLVPALDVMLHIVQTRHHLSPYKINGKDITLTPATPKNGKGAATKAATTNQWRQLYEQDITAEKIYYYKDAILDIWSQIERLMEKEDSIESGTGLALHGTMQSQVYGWEYMSLVHEKNYRRKEAIIAKTSGGWVDLINDIDALVLFATGLGDIIKPVADLSTLCPLWRNLPKGKDYLAACVPIMELLYSEAGSRLSQKHLSTTHLQWHRGSTLFEQCSGTISGHCECDRTQQVYHASLFRTFGRVRPPGNLEENGCVVFGQSRHPFRPTKAIAIRENAVHILPNISIQDGETTLKIQEKYDGLFSPAPPGSISPEPEEVNKYATRNSKRPPSPLRSSDGLGQEIAVVSKRRRRASHTPTSNFDTFKGPNDEDNQISWSSDCATSPLGYQSKPRHDEFCNEQHSGYTETVYPSEAEIAPVYVGRTLRHKTRIRRL